MIDTITQNFMPVQVNTQEESGKAISARYRQAWTPDIRVVGADGFDYVYFNGYLPPAEYVPQLLVAQAMAYLRLQDNQRAATIYQDVLNRFPTSAAAPEAAYFFAVARYKETHERTDLRGPKGWGRLQTRYPESTWRVRQSWTEDE